MDMAGTDDLDAFAQMLKTGQAQHELALQTTSHLTHCSVGVTRILHAINTPIVFKTPMPSITSSSSAAYASPPLPPHSNDSLSKLLTRPSSSLDTSQRHGGVLGETTRPVARWEFLSTRPQLTILTMGAWHRPNAFTATGNLQSFIARLLAHYFGWTVHAIANDTACLSSAIAIHVACRNLITGGCNAALPGGVTLCTNPLWFQNLAGAKAS